MARAKRASAIKLSGVAEAGVPDPIPVIEEFANISRGAKTKLDVLNFISFHLCTVFRAFFNFIFFIIKP